MKKIKDLTEDQFIQLLDQYYAKPEKRHKMSMAEVRDMAQRLNKKINVPIINETREEKILIKVIIKIDHFLYNNLPNEFYDLVRGIDRGIDDTEAKRLIVRLAKLANQHIDIPYIPEAAEYIAIRFVIGIIINAARKMWDMERAKQHMDQIAIPSEEDSTGKISEQLIAA